MLVTNLVGDKVEFINDSDKEAGKRLGIIRAVWVDTKGDLRCIVVDNESGLLVEVYAQGIQSSTR